MGWLAIAVMGAAGIASMKAALERGDIDEASRQGVLAGVATVEDALASHDRATCLAAIAAAPRVDARTELLEALASVARGPDRRTAIPAARAAAQIARELATAEQPDDLADADVIAWRDRWTDIAFDRTRWIEVRVLALDVAALVDRSLSKAGVGAPLATSLADPDPAFRRAALAQVPMPAPTELRVLLAKTVATDADPHVALAATAALCADLAVDPAGPILDVLGAPGIARVQAIATTPGAAPGALREAARCLAADKSPSSAASLRAIRSRLR